MAAAPPSFRTEHLEIVTDGARLVAIAEEWNALWRRVDGMIFQSHAWIAAWWSSAAERDRRALRIGLLWDGDVLAAVMPLATHHRRGLTFLEWAANAYSDYEDILASPDCPPEALRRLWEALAAAGHYDIALLNRLPPGALAHRVAGGGGKSALLRDRREEVAHRVVGPFAHGAAWLAAQSKKTRQNHRRGRKVLEENGRLEFRLVDPSEALEPILARLAVLKRQWLAARGFQSSLFDDGDPTLAALVDALAKAGLLRIFVLESDGVMVAVSVNFVQRDTMMAYVTTYDPAFERASPGTLLMMDYIVWAFDHDLAAVDFLCGAEAFKLRFATDVTVLTSYAGAGSLRGWLAMKLDRAIAALKAFRLRQTAQ